jgi:hypothetical protein
LSVWRGSNELAPFGAPPPFFVRMILSENRTPLFGIMRAGSESKRALSLWRRDSQNSGAERVARTNFFFHLSPPNSGVPEFGNTK